jgi:hypothetical protein
LRAAQYSDICQPLNPAPNQHFVTPGASLYFALLNKRSFKKAASMKSTMIAILLFFPLLSNAQDVEILANVEKARSEAPACRKLLAESKNIGSVHLQLMTYSELNTRAGQLSHCGLVFRIVGDAGRADAAGDESDRYDAMASLHMQRYLKAKGLWDDFSKNDCRQLSKTCGDVVATALRSRTQLPPEPKKSASSMALSGLPTRTVECES